MDRCTREEMKGCVILIRKHGLKWVIGEHGGIAERSKDHGGRRWRCLGNGCGVHGIVLVGTRDDFLDALNGWFDILFLYENRLNQIDIGHQVVGFVSFETLRRSTINIRTHALLRRSKLLFRSFVR